MTEVEDFVRYVDAFKPEEYPLTENIIWDRFPIPKCEVCGKQFPNIYIVGDDYRMRAYCTSHVPEEKGD